MGQLISSEEELADLKKTVGFVIYDAMVEGGATPDLSVVHPLLLANQNEDSVSQAYLHEHLQQIQRDLGKRAPTYLRDLIGRLSAFSDEPRLAGLVGLVVTMVMDVAYTSSKESSEVKGRPASWQLSLILTQLKSCLLGGDCDSRYSAEKELTGKKGNMLDTHSKVAMTGNTSLFLSLPADLSDTGPLELHFTPKCWFI
ncbi:hypothetical protein GOODEAATRI_026410 [Goodea atripinnis]|uniref:Uncharacterized protein n=1 Tax=Goodea atripinnis TaxID=208336 RepID=A0ABV0P1G8_9TELE